MVQGGCTAPDSTGRAGREPSQPPSAPCLLSPTATPLPTTHLVVGLTVHLAAGQGVALSTTNRAEGQVSRTVLIPGGDTWGGVPKAG